jgi:asparagine synthase (glutamine-hydrolysing)
MASEATATVPAFSIGAGGPLDEIDDASRYARALNVQHVVEHVAAADVLGMLDAIVDACSEPTGDPSIFPTAVVSRLARTRVTVALSGDGGDDLLWGYPGRTIRPLRAAEGRVDTWANRVSQAFGGPPPQPRRTPVSEDELRRIAGRTLARNRMVPISQLNAACPQLPSLPENYTVLRFEGRTLDEFAQWIRWTEYTQHLARILLKVDRASMHHSLEVRVPLLDREVIETAARVEWRSAVDLDHEVGKLPLRRALERRVGFQTSRKRGFDIPMDAWLRGPLRDHLHDLVINRQDIAGVPVSRAALSRLAARHRLHLDNASWLLWRLLSLALWEERHLKSAGHAGRMTAAPVAAHGHAHA